MGHQAPTQKVYVHRERKLEHVQYHIPLYSNYPLAVMITVQTRRLEHAY